MAQFKLLDILKRQIRTNGLAIIYFLLIDILNGNIMVTLSYDAEFMTLTLAIKKQTRKFNLIAYLVRWD